MPRHRWSTSPPSPCPTHRDHHATRRRATFELAVQVAPGATINLQGEIDWTIAQTPGSAFLRTDRLRDTDVVMLRYGDRATCWLAADDGRLVRFENDSAARTRPVVFDVIEFGPHPIGGPEVASVVDVAEICDQYEAVSAP